MKGLLDFISYERNQTDTYFTGKIYPKLDAYFLDAKGEYQYMCSSCQFKTQSGFKNWLANKYDAPNTRHLKIKKGE